VLLAGTGLLWAEGPEPDRPGPRKPDRDQGRKLYDLRYGPQRKAVDVTTKKYDDDIALASEHMADLAKYPDHPALRMVLCEEAFELGMRHYDGYPMAVIAADALLREFPEMRDENLPKAIRAYSAQRSGTPTATKERRIELYVEYVSTLAEMGRFDEAFKVAVSAAITAHALKSPRLDEVLVLRRYYQIRRDLQNRPSDLGRRREAILTAVRELDAPAEAATLLVKELDDELLTYVPLAARPRKDLAEAACLGLGDWYWTLADNASAWGKRVCLTRAKACFDRFLSLHQAKDDVRLKAERLRDQADKLLSGSRTPPAPTPPAAELEPVVTTLSKSLSVKKAWPFSMAIKKGQKIHIVASGKWRIVPGGRQHGPNAATYHFRGRIGNGKPFKVGAKYTLQVKQDGVLYLGIREGGRHGNNSGKLNVRITTTDFAPKADTAVAKPTADHDTYYQTVAHAYMNSNWPALNEQLKLYPEYTSRLSNDQRTDLNHVHNEAMDCPSLWWESAAGSKSATFTADIWGRPFQADYIPSELLGARKVAEIRDGRLKIVVTWPPQLIANPDPLDSERARLHDLTKGDFAESLVWHELGHHYVAEFLPADEVILLYNNHKRAFGQIQEFFADLTSLYHSRPKARKCLLFLHLPRLVHYDEDDPHTRAAYGIGSILLNEWLSDPENIDRNWPHIHLPARMPTKDIERNVLAYVYYHWDPEFSVSEDVRFREVIKRALMTKKAGQQYTEGERVFRSKGTIELSDGLEFRFPPGEDRPWKAKRDAWVKQQLSKAMEAGKTDWKGEARKIDPWQLVWDSEIISLIGGVRPGKTVSVPAPRVPDREQGSRVYQQRFGDRRKKVDASVGKDDDVAMAREHLRDAAKLAGDSALAVILREQAHQLGMRHRNGYATAAQAAESLLSGFPELRSRYLPMALRVYQVQFASGYDRSAAGERLMELYVDEAKVLAAAGKFDGFALTMVGRAQAVADTLPSPRRDAMVSLRNYYLALRDLQKRPTDLTLRRKTILFAIREVDAPGEADELLVRELDEKLLACVRLAAKPIEKVEEAACLELGTWYVELAQGTSGHGKAVCLNRAVAYLERFLKLHKAEDLSRTRGELLLDRAREGLSKSPETVHPALTPEDGWMDLLAVQGKLARSGAAPTPDGIRIGKLSTVQPVAVPFEAEFLAKTDSTNIRLAYGDDVAAIFNWEVRRDELRLHDIRTGKKHGIKGKGRVPTDTWVRIALAVSDTQMQVSVNGQLRGKISGNYEGLSRNLSIHSSQGSVVTVKAFRLRTSPPPGR